MKRTPSKIVKEKEEAFQLAMSNWEKETNPLLKKKYWDEMYERIIDCCANICKKRLANKGLTAERIQETWLDSANYAMDCITRLGNRPRKLSSYCYSYVTCYILKPQLKYEDMHIRTFSEYDEETEEVLLNKAVEDNNDTADDYSIIEINGQEFMYRKLGNGIEIKLGDNNIYIENTKEDEFYEKIYCKPK